MHVRETLTNLPLLVGLYVSICFSQIDGQQEFKPLTAGLAFKVLFKLERYQQGKPRLESEIYEQYDADIGWANIWSKANIFGTNKTEIRHFIHTGYSTFDIELPETDDSRIMPMEFSHIDKGHEFREDKQDNLMDTFKLLKVVKKEVPLDQVLLGYTWKDKLFDIDSYLTPECQNPPTLDHVVGISRLLHLLECRRKEFIVGLENQEDFERELMIRSYTFTGKPTDDLKKIYVKVSLSNLVDHELSLPSRTVPMKIHLEFKDNTDIFVNIYQFRSIQSLDGTAKEVFIVPPGRGYSIQIPEHWGRIDPNNVRTSSNVERLRDGFSFRATLWGPSVPLKYPVELLVAFDSSKQMLAFQKITSHGLRGTMGHLKKSVTREVFDAKTGIRFHVMHSNNDHVFRPGIGPRNAENWRTCASDFMSMYNVLALESGHSEVFDPVGATLMGFARIRGVLCRVYERRIDALPPWLGLDDHNLYMENDLSRYRIVQTFSVFYKAVQDPIGGSLARVSQHDGGRLMRIELRALALVGQERRLESLFYLDVFSFTWSSILSDHGAQESLFDVAQDCILSDPSLDRLDLSLELQSAMATSDRRASQALRILQESDIRRRDAVTFGLASSALNILPIQQDQLLTWFNHHDKLQVRLRLFEMPTSYIVVDELGYAKDLSTWFEDSDTWSAGVTTSSRSECQFWAAHYLRPGGSTSESQIYVYCPNTMHCMLVNQNMVRNKLFTLYTYLHYPADPTSHSCFVTSIRLAAGAKDLNFMSLNYGANLNQLKDVGRREYLRRQTLTLPVRGSEFVEVDTGEYDFKAAFSISRLEVSQLSDRLTELVLVKTKGFTYDPPQDVEALKVQSVAQCERTCLMHHECASYALCHWPIRNDMDCLLTRVNWTHSNEVSYTLEVFNEEDVQEDIDLSIIVSMDIGQAEPLDVRFKKSSLCSIHPLKHSSLFKLKNTQTGTLVGTDLPVLSESLLAVEEMNQCAELCIHRAYFASLAKLNYSSVDDRYRVETCTSFKFDKKSERCSLLPFFNLTRVVQLLDSERRPPAAAGWIRALNEATANKVPKRFNEIEHYELDYKQVFSNNHLGKQITLTLAEDQDQIGQEPITSASDCARMCLQRRSCISYDMVAVSSSIDNNSITSCVLRSSMGHSGWQEKSRHFEPTEIALHLMGERWLGEERKDSTGIYIDVSSVEELIKRMTRGDHKIDLNTTRSTESHTVATYLGLLILLTILSLVMIVVFRYRLEHVGSRISDGIRWLQNRIRSWTQ